jgi:RNA polymerase primary sigma factor
VTKKRTKTLNKKTAKKEAAEEVVTESGSAEIDKSNNTEEQIKMLIKKGEKKGFLTYEEMNDDLPEDAVSAVRLDRLLATLDERGISLLDEADVVSQQAAKAGDDEFDEAEVSVDEEDDDKEKQLKDEDELLEKRLVGEDVARRIDDPIRMYLTQMGDRKSVV